MFSNFKNIVTSGLNELERLGDELNASQNQRGQQQLHRGYSESVLPTAGQSSGLNAGFSFPRATSPLSASNGTYSNTSQANGAPNGSSGDRERRDSFDNFTASFGLSGLKRSLSGIPKTSLDLRNTFDVNASPTMRAHASQSVDLTPSRDGRELGEYPGFTVGGLSLNTNVPSTSLPPKNRLKRRASARSASLSGPYTPNTMIKMDPFFFATLQGLPDELKQAAFTPLPTEDDDELLEQLDAEFSPSTSRPHFIHPFLNTKAASSMPISAPSHQSGYPTTSLSRSLPASVPSSFRPSSAPAGASFPFSSATSVRSPLAEPARLLSSVLDAHEEEQLDAVLAEEETEESPFRHTLSLEEEQVPEQREKQTEEQTPGPIFDDLPEDSREPSQMTEKAEVRDEAPTDTAKQPPQAGSAEYTSTSGAPEPQTDSTQLIDAQVEPVSEASIAVKESAAPTFEEKKPEHPDLQTGTGVELPKPNQSSASAPETTKAASEAPLEPSPNPIAPSEPTQKEPASAPKPQPNTPIVVSPPKDAPIASATPPKHESLAARLARISRASSPKAPAAPSLSATAKADPASSSPRQSLDISRPSSPAHLPESPVSSTSTKLQDERAKLEKLLRQYTTVTTAADLAGLEAFLKSKANAPTQNDVENLRIQLEKEQAKITAVQNELAEARAATTKAETKAKDEEEKKAKSITLLKAVRQKLIKSEKDKEEAEVMRDAARASEEQSISETRQLRQRFDSETLSLRTTQEQQLNRLKASFEREANSIRAAYEQQAVTRKNQAEVDIMTVRSAHAKELAARDSRINALEENLREARREKDKLFQESQSRQAEVESATSEQQRLQAAHEEMQYELRDARDKASSLQEEVQSFKKARLDQTRDEGHTRRLLAEAESNHAEKVKGYEDRVKALERERSDIEERMAKKLQEKLREVEQMRRDIEKKEAENGEEVQLREERQQRTERAEALNRSLQERVTALEMFLNEAKDENAHLQEDHNTTRELLADQSRRTSELEARNEELQSKEAQLRASNRTLREELRKVQSGVLLSERSRNPGVGYFSNFSTATGDSRSPPFTPPIQGAVLSRAPSTTGSVADGDRSQDVQQQARKSTDTIGTQSGREAEEALNFEYIRNVILQFLEHKEMRPHLVSVLGVILHFTPSETRRLSAKASA